MTAGVVSRALLEFAGAVVEAFIRFIILRLEISYWRFWSSRKYATLTYDSQLSCVLSPNAFKKTCVLQGIFELVIET